MAKSNRNRVGDSLDVFVEGMLPFVSQEMKSRHNDAWEDKVREIMRENPSTSSKAGNANIAWDTALIISVVIKEWQYLFRKKLGAGERAMIHELSDVRNRWAHQERFSTDDTLRALDTMHRLLSSVGAGEQAAEVDRLKSEVMRTRFQELSKQETQRANKTALSGQPTGGLKSWRDVVTPHPDVASGRFAQAEFAADLAQVIRGDATHEYGNPAEFFRRTYLTEGLRELLLNAISRLTGQDGDPVVELQTNFGGGKTHSMLALYHLFSDAKSADLAGVDVLLKELNVDEPPKAARAVIVGTALSAGQPHTKDDGTEVRTIWGEIAHQLMGKAGYDIVADCDKNGTAPGSDLLSDLFKAAGPTLILIDEWVAYIRQTYETPGLPGGSFDANLTFAQALTEAAKSPQVLVVASLPQSQIEVGGEGGQKALDLLQNTFTRVKSSWRPASQEESYEIVRRRLFEPISGENFAARDAVLEAFASMYRQHEAEFPSGVRESEYIRKMEVAYPVHPELFERLYSDWASLEEFQRTRGVLRLLACAIYSLWEGNDKSLMIMPAMIPMDDQHVLSEITTKSGLSPVWTNVIERDVDGNDSLSRKIDREISNLGRLSACRRVARTIYIGSAPIAESAKKGVDDRRVRLGCVQPGESVPIFGDALRRLTDQATHLYVDGTRYWFSTQPSVTRLAQDRAAEQKLDVLLQEIAARIKQEKRLKGEFHGIHDCPDTSSDIADEPEVRLVIMGPDHPHRPKAQECKCLLAAKEILEQRGNSPRIYRNSLVFLAADKTRLDELIESVRAYLAWKSIVEQSEQLNLDSFQKRQAETKLAESDSTVASRLPETYQWLLVPVQPNPTESPDWQTFRLTGQGSLAERASRKLVNEEYLMPQYSGVRLKMDLDRIPLWRGDHVLVKELAENMAQYLYLPRLTDRSVLIKAIEDGLATLTWRQDTFAYAHAYDADRNRYQGLIGGTQTQISVDSGAVVVKSDVAVKQMAAEEESKGTSNTSEAGNDSAGSSGSTTSELGKTGDSVGRSGTATLTQPKRFYGSVKLDATRLGRDAGRIATEVLSHLAGLPGADATVSLEIEIEIPDGVPENVVRTVIENCRTLKFDDQGFDND
ncbi:hypothetical protein SAMN06265222_10793 [Neorhodopirellula lusitana]|uniref:Swt1-like HEPN domain-containing protein n=1 Tax=Neorhodopirellula lusitana TaxID=445327 RepID=A0ABY1Q726_9BACT|nr:DUF499 domain-containing protein [Neorhodopirellula lusitana]SMP61398.1 hypothetical protein SAMN06265222_10793 [Neorhodopirellula lusitana]